jgi:AcrR family transcriptional regulator
MSARADGPGYNDVVRIAARSRGGDEGADAAQLPTRQRILKAAREIFFRDGFVDTNLDEVASRAEVGKGTLYRHFESKAELYVAVLAVGGAQFDQEMEAAIDHGAPALERLEQIGRFYRRYWTERPDHFVIFSAVEHRAFIGELPPRLVEEVRQIWEKPLRRLEQVIADGVRRRQLLECDPWVTANVIWRAGNAAVSALVTPKRSRVIDCSAEAIYGATLDMLLCGLARNEQGDELTA